MDSTYYHTNKAEFISKNSAKKRSKLLKAKRIRVKEIITENEYNQNTSQIEKKEYFDILNKFSEEYQELGYDLEIISKQSKMNITFSKLYIDLFSLTKFENSKPYRMIDYIINNDRINPLSDVDKSNFEKMKKKVLSNSRNELNNNTQFTIFKSLYQNFK